MNYCIKIKFSILLLFYLFTAKAQFQFSGKVNENFQDAIAYLSIVDDCSKQNLFLTENILQEVKINIKNEFIFKGDFLSENNRIYKIHIDNCHDGIGDYKHVLNHCDDSKEIFFIASNNDIIYFPLNDLSQMFCSLEQSKKHNSSILKIDNLEEEILTELQFSKNDIQRKNIYKSHFEKLQKYSKTFNEPLTELYTFHLYANDKSLSKDYYLNDLKRSKYYNNLLKKLENSYPNTSYTNNFKTALIKDQYPLLKTKSMVFQYLSFGLALLLLMSLYFNYIHVKKTKKSAATEVKLDYKKLLTPQEQKVFELMLNNSNKEIAEKLFISLSTVKTHINNIYSKLAISSRKEISHFF